MSMGRRAAAAKPAGVEQEQVEDEDENEESD